MEMHASKEAGRKGSPVPMSWWRRSPGDGSSLYCCLLLLSSSCISSYSESSSSSSLLSRDASRLRSIRSLAMLSMSRETSHPTQTCPCSSST